MREQRPKCRRSDAGRVQDERRDVDDAAVGIAKGSIGEDQLANAMPWSRERW
jgi:hypothetical protein